MASLGLVVTNAPEVLAAPPSTISWYVSITNLTTWYNGGCALGTSVLNTPGTQVSIVSLGFGAPKYFAATNSYGASFYGAPDDTIATAIAVTDAYAHGYYVCSSSDTSSSLTLAMGTSNDGSQVTSAHGSNWAAGPVWENAVLAGRTNHWQTFIVAALDVEPSDGNGHFNTFAATKPWIDAYSSYTGRASLYANAACFASATITYVASTSCGIGWTVDNMDYAVWRLGPMYPLPQVYHTDGHDGEIWYRMSKYHVTNYTGRYTFASVMSSQLACSQTTGGCPGADLGPADSWSFLQWYVNTDSTTATPIPPPTNVSK